MKKNTPTRFVTDQRHWNNQNPNVNPGAARARVPQMVREMEYTGEVRSILVTPSQSKQVQVNGRMVNGAPMPVAQSKKAKKYE